MRRLSAIHQIGVTALSTGAFALGVLASWEVASAAGYVPTTGFVPDAGTAVAVAEAVLVPIYGARQVYSERPFHASLRGQVWTVEGSLRPGWIGGAATVSISKSDARILGVFHTK